MEKDTSKKIYPTASESVAKMLGIEQVFSESKKEEGVEITEEHKDELKANSLHTNNNQNNHSHATDHSLNKTDVVENRLDSNTNKILAIFKRLLPYALLFLVGLFGYYFFLSNTNLNLSGIVDKVKTENKPLTQKDSALQALQKDSALLSNYEKWVKQYYFEVNDYSVIDPNVDNSGNGLTNFQKFLFGLNPKSFDTLLSGKADSEILALGMSPLTGQKLSSKEKDLVEKYFDLEIINNRLAINAFQKQKAQVAGEITNGFGFSAETARNGEKITQRQNQNIDINLQRNSLENPFETFDLNTPGRLEIPSLKINVPLIWTKDPKDFEKDLQTGVVHYPGTALPGQIGTTYISGHSSNFLWAKGNYNTVFEKLGDLPDNTSFIITVVQKNGKDARFHYVVVKRKEYSPTDQEQFKNTGESMVALSTCWPVGSTKSRLVVFGKLTQAEK